MITEEDIYHLVISFLGRKPIPKHYLTTIYDLMLYKKINKDQISYSVVDDLLTEASLYDYDLVPSIAKKIARIKHFHYQYQIDTNPTEDTFDDCPICHDTITKDDYGKLLCDHIFHHQCLLDWFKINATCPICRDDAEVLPCKYQVEYYYAPELNKPKIDKLVGYLVKKLTKIHQQRNLKYHEIVYLLKRLLYDINDPEYVDEVKEFNPSEITYMIEDKTEFRKLWREVRRS